MDKRNYTVLLTKAERKAIGKGASAARQSFSAFLVTAAFEKMRRDGAVRLAHHEDQADAIGYDEKRVFFGPEE